MSFIEHGQRWEHVHRPTGKATLYTVENFSPNYLGGLLVYLRNAATGGLAQVSSRQMTYGLSASSYFWRRAETTTKEAAAALERPAA